MKYVLYTDGAARGNPGPAAIGVVLKDAQGNVIDEQRHKIDDTTNNEAEYRALLFGLELATGHGITELEIRTDSELMARQVNGLYKVRKPHLKSLHAQAIRALAEFKSFSVTIIPRELNRRADALANEALDQSISGRKRA